MFDNRTYRLRSPLPETQLFFRNLTGGEVLSSISHYQLVALSPSANLPLDQLAGATPLLAAKDAAAPSLAEAVAAGEVFA